MREVLGQAASPRLKHIQLILQHILTLHCSRCCLRRCAYYLRNGKLCRSGLTLLCTAAGAQGQSNPEQAQAALPR